MSKKELRNKFGVSCEAIPATRVLVKGMDHDFGVESHSLIIIDDQSKTFTAANVYGGNCGKGYDPANYRHPLPEASSEKWKIWRKKGYVEGNVADFDVLARVEVEEVASTEA